VTTLPYPTVLPCPDPAMLCPHPVLSCLYFLLLLGSGVCGALVLLCRGCRSVSGSSVIDHLTYLGIPLCQHQSLCLGARLWSSSLFNVQLPCTPNVHGKYLQSRQVQVLEEMMASFRDMLEALYTHLHLQSAVAHCCYSLQLGGTQGLSPALLFIISTFYTDLLASGAPLPAMP